MDRSKRTNKKILVRFAILAPMLVGMAIMIRPMVAHAWTWYKPWTWPIVESAYYAVKDVFVDPSESFPANDLHKARVMVEGEDNVRDFYSNTAIAWNYAVAKANQGKKVIVKLMDDWNACEFEENVRTQFPSKVEGGSGSDRKWYLLHHYDMGADMRYKDIPYLGDSSDDTVDSFQDGGILVPTNTDITIDLNGHWLWRAAEFKYIDDGEVIHVKGGAKLTIIDSDPDKYHQGYPVKGGVIQGGSSTNGAGGIQIKDGASVTIEKCTFYQNSSSNDGGAIKIDGKEADLKIDGTIFKDNCCTDAVIERNYGGAIACYDATVDIRNVLFEENMADNRGGGLYNNSGKLNMTDCRFINNRVSDYGGAMYLESDRDDPRMLIHKIDISKCNAKEGGGIYFEADGATDVFDANITNNDSKRGGGIYVNKKGACLVDTQITKNYADDCGGGIYVDSLSDLNLAGKIIVDKNSKTIDYYTSNVLLQDGNASRAYLNNGGLTEGSKIGVASSKKDMKDVEICKNTTQFAAEKYFSSDSSAYKTEVVDGKYETGSYVASLIGGDDFVLIVLTVISITAVVIILILVDYKKRKEAKSYEK